MDLDECVLNAAKELVFQMDSRKVPHSEVQKYIKAAIFDDFQDKLLAEVIQNSLVLVNPNDPVPKPEEDPRCVIRVGTRIFTAKPECFDPYPHSIFAQRLRAFPESKFFDFPNDDPAVYAVLHDIITGASSVPCVLSKGCPVSRDQISDAARKYRLYEIIDPVRVEGRLNAYATVTDSSHPELRTIFENNVSGVNCWFNMSALGKRPGYVDVEFGPCTVFPSVFRQITSPGSFALSLFHVYVLAPAEGLSPAADALTAEDRLSLNGLPNGSSYRVICKAVWRFQAHTWSEKHEIHFETASPLTKMRIAWLSQGPFNQDGSRHAGDPSIGVAHIFGKAAVRF